jgi:hypothetical protein
MMKGLSIRQPWAWCIMTAGKRIENRAWFTKYRGPILIHAAKGLTQLEYYNFCDWYADHFPANKKPPAMMDLARGGIVGRAKIVDCVEASTDPWFMGRYGFLLDEVERIEFIPYKGALGLFDVPDDVLTKVAA